jgi:hypothetical protein
MSTKTAPNCPNCGETMLPTSFGMPMGPDPSVYQLGCLVSENMPEFGCNSCDCLLYADGTVELPGAFE